MTSSRPFETFITVRYAECDAMAIAHHASYLPWFEIGRTEMLAACGHRYRDLETAGIFLPVQGLEVAYRRPVRYDDRLRLVTRLRALSAVRAEFSYEIFGADGQSATTAFTRHAVTGRDGRITRMPAAPLTALNALLTA
jgi:acyl-CoA thioester hydrolase